jgi:hypothetical protein
MKKQVLNAQILSTGLSLAKMGGILLLFLALSSSQPLKAQQADAKNYAETINAIELKAHLQVIASDSMQGRETGTEGNWRAAQYIANQLEKWGLPKIGDKGTYFQRMVYTNEGWDNISLRINEKGYRHQYSYYAFPFLNPSVKEKIEASEIVFLGYGIDTRRYSDYGKKDLKGKVIMILPGEPRNDDSTYVISKSKEMSVWSKDIKTKLQRAYQTGVKAVLIIDPNFQDNVQEGRRYFNRSITGDVELPDGKLANSIFISPELAKEIIGKNAKEFARVREKCEAGKPRMMVIPCQMSLVMDKFFKQLMGNNIMAYIEGSDPVLKNEWVIISAHYDHIGTRGTEINYGADDNGSGTSTLLELTQALLEAKKAGQGSRRSMLCLFLTGEEKGLLGSKYYVTYPVFPLEKTVANVNIDMVGRVDDKYQAMGNPNYIYVIGADKMSQDLHDINEAMNKKYTNLTLDYTYNDENDPNRYYYRSDHYNFAERGIPAIFYFNGTHDDYHRPTDTIEKINFDKMAKIGKLAFFTAWELANRDERIRITKGKFKQRP